MKSINLTLTIFLISVSLAYTEPKVIAILPFENQQQKSHLEFVKNIVHEKLFTALGSTVTDSALQNEANVKKSTIPYIVIGVASVEDAKQIFKLSGGKVPSVILQGEYFMIRDRMALNVSLINPDDGSRMEGTGELLVYKGHRHPELPGQANFQKSLYEDIQEPLNNLLKGVRDLIEGKNKEKKK